MALKGTRPHIPSIQILEKIERAIQTNGFQNNVLHYQHLVLDGVQSIVNHSCDPNLTTAFQALRGIHRGEEVSFDYPNDRLFLLLPTWRRRQAMASAYSFNCLCKRCTAVGGIDPFDTALRCTNVLLTEAQEEALYQRVLAMFSVAKKGTVFPPPENASSDAPAAVEPYEHLWDKITSVCTASHYLIQLFRCGHLRPECTSGVRWQREKLLQCGAATHSRSASLGPLSKYIYAETMMHDVINDAGSVFKRPV